MTRSPKLWVAIMAASIVAMAGLSVMLNGVAAGAKAGPQTAACTGLLGGPSADVLTGCSATAGTPRITSSGMSVATSVTPSGGAATVYWTNKKFTTVTFAASSMTNTCPSYLNSSALEEEQYSVTVTGGNAKLTIGPVSGFWDVCVYADASGHILLVGLGSENI